MCVYAHALTHIITSPLHTHHSYIHYFPAEPLCLYGAVFRDNFILRKTSTPTHTIYSCALRLLYSFNLLTSSETEMLDIVTSTFLLETHGHASARGSWRLKGWKRKVMGTTSDLTLPSGSTRWRSHCNLTKLVRGHSPRPSRGPLNTMPHHHHRHIIRPGRGHSVIPTGQSAVLYSGSSWDICSLWISGGVVKLLEVPFSVGLPSFLPSCSKSLHAPTPHLPPAPLPGGTGVLTACSLWSSDYHKQVNQQPLFWAVKAQR